ncbi:hypothetical protein [Dyella sp.]|uniref:hypothetical protein n=1 Tax=Dyella sp. TaxID=1869338 RepID=UPI003F8169F9
MVLLNVLRLSPDTMHGRSAGLADAGPARLQHIDFRRCGRHRGPVPDRAIARFGSWSPGSMPLRVFATRADRAMQVITVSLIGGALQAWLGMWQFQHREQA